MSAAARHTPATPFSPFGGRRKHPSTSKYWALLILVAAGLFVAQSFWMKRVRAKETLAIDSSLIFKLTNFLNDRSPASTTSDPTHTPATIPAGTSAAAGVSALAPGTEIVPCHLCEGLGRTSHPETGDEITCPLCQGHGSRLIRRQAANESLCPACGGIGLLLGADGVSTETCLRCEGRGLVASDAAPAAAPTPVTPEPVPAD